MGASRTWRARAAAITRWTGVVLAVALVALWVRSYFRWDLAETRFGAFDGPRASTAANAAPGDVEHAYIARTLRIFSARGIIHFGATRYESIALPDENPDEFRERWRQQWHGPKYESAPANHLVQREHSIWWWVRSFTEWSVLGFGTESGGRQGETWRIVCVPHAAVAFLCALPMTLRLMAWKRRRIARRLRAGQCVHCGYDCRSDGKVLETCPECGKPSAGG